MFINMIGYPTYNEVVKMTEFIAVDYRRKQYPRDIRCNVKEVSGHLDKTSIDSYGRYSLHTEYSFTKRNLNSNLIEKYPALKTSEHGIPKLWYDDEWAVQFGCFIIDLVGDNDPPEVIEIHPPFKDYCNDFDTFIKRYRLFEEIITEKYSDVIITMENRSGSQYAKSKFLMSTMSDICTCGEMIKSENVRLHFAVDYTQLFTSEGYDFKDIPIEEFIMKHDELKDVKDLISSIHLWGKSINKNGRWNSHTSGLRDILPGYKTKIFLDMINEFYDDGIKRYFVPEINTSDEYVKEIVEDCISSGIYFV